MPITKLSGVHAQSGPKELSQASFTALFFTSFTQLSYKYVTGDAFCTSLRVNFFVFVQAQRLTKMPNQRMDEGVTYVFAVCQSSQLFPTCGELPALARCSQAGIVS